MPQRGGTVYKNTDVVPLFNLASTQSRHLLDCQYHLMGMKNRHHPYKCKTLYFQGSLLEFSNSREWALKKGQKTWERGGRNIKGAMKIAEKMKVGAEGEGAPWWS